MLDEELAAIRARRRAEILAQFEGKALPPAAPEPAGMPDLDDAGLDAFVRAHKVVLVDVWAPWCGPCRTMSPLVEELGRAWGTRAAVAKMNADENPDVVARYRISGIPAFLWFKDGQFVGRQVGVQPREAFEQVLAEVESA